MVRQIAGNSIVLIGNLDASQVTPETLPQALGRDRLAIGHRDAVPAGSYARAWLESTGLWTALQDRLAETDNVRAALLLVARGQTSYGVVYATDARAEPAVRVLYDVPSETHPPIRYPAAALTAAGQPFVDYLTGPTAQDIFATHGFKKAAP
jgi:molybdate transport system substrate-binding protein